MGISGKFFVDDGRIGGGLRNSGDEVFLYDSIKEDTLASMAYGAEGNKNMSLVMWPEGVGHWQLHTEFPGTGKLFSPGMARVVTERIKMDHQDTSVAMGDSLHLSVTQLLSDGSAQPALDSDLSWHTSKAHVLIYEHDGFWVGSQAGIVEIHSDLNGFLSDTISVRVLPPQVVALNVSLSDSLLLVGNRYALNVEGVISGTEKTVLPDGYQVAVSDSIVMSYVDGIVEARSPGIGEVTVSYEGLLGGLNIKVAAHGDLNADGAYTIWDAVRLVHLILGIEPEGNAFELQSADLTQDDKLDIRDLIGVIQHILGGEVSSTKPVKYGPVVGLKEIESGVSLNIPPKTVAITFKIKCEYKNKVIKTSGGQIIFEQGIGGIEGVILPNLGGAMVWQDQTVRVIGECDFDQTEWVAWTLDGQGYLLLPQDSGNGPLGILDASPNPLNPSTTINYRIPVAQDITLSVYNATGQWVCDLFDGFTREGSHQIVWDGQDVLGRSVASGLYFAHLKGEFEASTLKMVVLR